MPQRSPTTPRSLHGHERYSLATVARLTGLTPDLIRVWERRYGVVNPVRGPRGARLYGSADIERLRLLSAAVRSGRSIGDVAQLANEELLALSQVSLSAGQVAPPTPTSSQAITRPESLSSTIDAVLAAVERFDQPRVEHLLGEALLALGASSMAELVLAPLLHEVGNRWLSGTLTVAHEHFLSAILRDLLSGVLRLRRRNVEHPEIVLATPEGEAHEFGLLLAALTLADCGLAVCYLGSSVPALELVDAARKLAAKVVALSIVSTTNRTRAIEAVNVLRKQTRHSVCLWLGGGDAVATVSALRSDRDVVLIPTLPELREHARDFLNKERTQPKINP